MEVSLSLVKNKKGGIKSMKKRILALLMALVMVFGLNTTFMAEPGDSATVDNTQETEIPSEVDVEWDSNWGIILNHVGADANYVSYVFTIYKDGVEVGTRIDYWWGETNSYWYNFAEYITESGTYQVKVEAEYEFYVYDEETDSYKCEYKTIKGETDAVAYTNPGKALAVPTNIKIENGILSFDTVEGTDHYLVTFYQKYVENGYSYDYAYDWYTESDSVSINLNNWFSGTYDLDVYVSVQAISDDIDTICSSSESALVGPFEYRIEKKATTITWSTEELATAIVGNLSSDENAVDYYFDISKNGVSYGNRWAHGYANELTYVDLTSYLRDYGAGTYLAELEAYESGFDANDMMWRVFAKYIAESNYTYAPANTLATPGNATLSSENKLTFNTVEGAEYYQVYYRIEKPNSGEVSEGVWCSIYVPEGETTGSFDATEAVEEMKYWYEDDTKEVIVSIGLRAISGDIENTASSEAVWFTVLNTVKTAEQVEAALDKALENIESDPEAAHEVLVGTSNDTLVELMKDPAFVEKVKKAETAYVEAMKITQLAPVSSVAAIDASKITVVGAALNAGFADDVQLTVSKPTKEVSVPTGYKNALQLDINLLISGEAMEDLDVPVTITMPIPTGVDTKNLVILHYHGDATEPTVITPVVNADGTMTFTVTGFSTFVIANSVASPGTNDVTPVAAVCGIMLLAAAVVVMRKRNLVK